MASCIAFWVIIDLIINKHKGIEFELMIFKKQLRTLDMSFYGLCDIDIMQEKWHQNYITWLLKENLIDILNNYYISCSVYLLNYNIHYECLIDNKR